MSGKMRCRLCDSEIETIYIPVNGRKLYLCADCLILISQVVKDSIPGVLEEVFNGIKKNVPKWQLNKAIS